MRKKWSNAVKLVTKIRVKNDLGLHTRPATSLVKLLQHVKSEVLFSYKRDTVNAKSILSILMLAIHKNASVTITVDGEDAEETMAKILNAFENKFGE
jgi:phosphocarrier protein HPr